MSQKRLASFDDLVTGYYGRGPDQADPRKRVEDLFSTYYGRPPSSSSRRGASPAVSLSLGCDDGEILSQPTPRPRSGNAPVSHSQDFEEYVIDIVSTPSAGPTLTRDTPRRAPSVGSSAGSSAPTAPPRITEQEDGVNKQWVEVPRNSTTTPTPLQNAPGSVSGGAGSSSQSMSASTRPTEDDILGDLDAIIRGHKVYDKDAGGMVDRASVQRRPGESGTGGAPRPATSNGQSNGQEIFDRIAQSMQYANAYDLGTVELENRFADFDRQDEQRKQSTKPKRLVAQSAPSVDAPPSATASAQSLPDTSDFIADLDTIKSQATRPISQPLYDTGEHVLAGNSLYAGRLRVGKGSAVALSYGQVISMADLYDSVDQMMNADAAELNRLKALIVRDTAFYEGKGTNKSMGVGNDTWDKATSGRYLKLAENNYEHFSPATVLMGAGTRTRHGDNKTSWEFYHRRAIEAAQDQFLKSSGNVSLFFEWPLTINAFGDHFLTDAFAAGHLINKEVMIDKFKASFYTGTALNSAGESFFEKVANTAWQGDVKDRFSALETVDWAHWHGIWLPFHPNIDSASRFGEVLKESARQQPDRVANLVVKALHDYLNENGVEVSNSAGDGTWMLPGDGSLMIPMGSLTQANLDKNLMIMRKAVQQSVDDINSPAIRASNVDVQALFDGVWRYVPLPTAASKQKIAGLMRDYTDPNSTVLVNAAAVIIKKQLNSFIDVLVNEHKLKPA